MLLLVPGIELAKAATSLHRACFSGSIHSPLSLALMSEQKESVRSRLLVCGSICLQHLLIDLRSQLLLQIKLQQLDLKNCMAHVS